MEQTTTETEKPKDMSWQEAAIEANEPAPRHFTDKLPCKLSDGEMLEIARRQSVQKKKREAYEEETKRIVSERKNGLAVLVAEEKTLENIFDTGREDRDIAQVEYVSFRVGKKWKIRLDTDERFDERALTAQERQSLLPNVNGAQLSLAAAATGATTEATAPAEVAAENGASVHDSADGDDAEEMLAAAEDDEDDEDLEDEDD